MMSAITPVGDRHSKEQPASVEASKSSIGYAKPSKLQQGKPTRKGKMYRPPAPKPMPLDQQLAAEKAAHAAAKTSLANKLASLTCRLQQAHAALAAEQSAHAATAAALQQEQQLRASIASQLAEAQQQAAAALAAKDEALLSYQSSVQQKQEEVCCKIAAIEQELAHVTTTFSLTAASLQQEQATNVQLTEQLAAQKDLVAAGAAALAVATEQLREEQHQRAAVSQALADADAQLEAATASLAQLQDVYLATTQQLAFQTAAAVAAVSNGAAMQQEPTQLLAAAEGKYRSEKDRFAVKAAEARGWQWRVSKADAKSKQLQLDLASLERTASTAAAQLKAEVDELQAKASTMGLALAEVKAEVAAAASQLAENWQQLSEAQQENFGWSCWAAIQAVGGTCGEAAAVEVAGEEGWASAAGMLHTVSSTVSGALTPGAEAEVASVAAETDQQVPAVFMPVPATTSQQAISRPAAQSLRLKFSARQLFVFPKTAPPAVAVTTARSSSTPPAAAADTMLSHPAADLPAVAVTGPAGKVSSKTSLKGFSNLLTQRKLDSLSSMSSSFWRRCGAKLAAGAAKSGMMGGRDSLGRLPTVTPLGSGQAGLQAVTGSDFEVNEALVKQLGRWGSSAYSGSGACALDDVDGSAACTAEVLVVVEAAASGDGDKADAEACRDGAGPGAAGKASEVCLSSPELDVAVYGDAVTVTV